MVKELHESRVSDRREFLRCVSGSLAASGMVLAGSAAAETPSPPAAASPLPMISLGNDEISDNVVYVRKYGAVG
jgi:hypothetical protein